MNDQFGFVENPEHIRRGLVAKYLNSLTNEQIHEFASKLLDGYRPCSECQRLRKPLYKIPQKIKKRFPYILNHSGEACDYCISGLVTKYNQSVESEKKELAGHINLYFGVFGPGKRNKKGGVVYLCRHEQVYKIGASTSPYERIRIQGYSESHFVDAVETYYPFDLEKYLHQRFREKVAGIELFSLDEVDIDIIKEIKTVNGIQAYHYKTLNDLKEFPKVIGG